MISSDKTLVLNIDGVRYIVVDDRLQTLEQSNRELHDEVRALSEKLDLVLVRVNAINDRIDDMKFYVSLTFGALAVFVGIAALIPIVSKLIQAIRKPALTAEQVGSMIDDAIAKASNDIKTLFTNNINKDNYYLVFADRFPLLYFIRII